MTSPDGYSILRPSVALPLVLVLLLVFLAATGCGPRSASAGRLPDGRLIVNFWNGFTGPDGKTMQALVQHFQEENRDLVVRMQIIPWATYYDKLTLSLAYGGAPELFVVHADRLPEFASFGKLKPIAPLLAVASPPLAATDFAPLPWSASFYRGQQFGLPLDVHPVGLYYNTRLFEEAGIVDRSGRARPPVTWEEFLSDAQRLTHDADGDGRPDQWGFVFTDQRNNWFTFAYQFGGGILTPDGKSCGMESAQNRAAMERMRDLIHRYHVAPKPEGVDSWLAFRQGKVGMAIQGIYMLASLEEQEDLAYAGAPVPQFGPVRATYAGSHILCQAAEISAERSQAAWRLTRFLSDHSLAWAKGGQVPVRLSVLRSPEFAGLRVQSQFALELPYVRYSPPTPRLNAIFPFVDPAIEDVLLDLASPEAALKDACRRIEQVLKRA